MTSVVRPYRGVSAEDRLVERRARLKRAGLDLVGQGGVAAVTASAVCGRAGLSKRYFYESFGNRDELLREMLDDFFSDVHTEIVEAVDGTGPSPRQRAHVVAQTLIDFLRRDTRRARLYVESAGHPHLQSRREAAFDLFTRLLLDTFGSPASPGADPTDERSRWLAALIVVAGTTQAATHWLQGTIELGRDEVVEEIAHAITAAFAPRGR